MPSAAAALAAALKAEAVSLEALQANSDAQGSRDISDAAAKIMEKLESIERRLGDIENSTSRMDSHIDFVNQCYIAFRFPLEVGRTIMTRAAPLLGIEDVSHQRAITDGSPTSDYDEVIQDLEKKSLPLLPRDQLPRKRYD